MDDPLPPDNAGLPAPERDVPARAYPRLRRALRIAAVVLAGMVITSVLWVAVYGFAGPPVTFIMLRDTFQGKVVDRRTVDLEAIAPQLWHAVMTAEDQAFCLHHGFDWSAIAKAQDHNARGGRLRGASTISMQTAKNAFLWPGRTWVRKGAEAYFTLLIETLWTKRRIMEVYLSIAEWGDAVYGAEAAAQHYFGTPAAALTAREAALLAAALPSPLTSNPARPSRYLARRASEIQRQMEEVGRSFAGCLER